MTARGIRHRFVSEMHRNELPEFWAELGLLSSPDLWGKPIQVDSPRRASRSVGLLRASGFSDLALGRGP